MPYTSTISTKNNQDLDHQIIVIVIDEDNNPISGLRIEFVEIDQENSNKRNYRDTCITDNKGVCEVEIYEALKIYIIIEESEESLTMIDLPYVAQIVDVVFRRLE